MNTIDQDKLLRDKSSSFLKDSKTEAIAVENIIRQKDSDDLNGFRKRNAKSMSIPPINLSLANQGINSNGDSTNTKVKSAETRLRR